MRGCSSRAMREVERRRHPATRGGDALDALERGGRAAGQPQAAVGGEALLRREVVDVDLGRGPRAARRRRTWRRRRRAPSPAPRRREIHHHAGRGLVVGERVDVDAGVADGPRVGAGRRCDDLGCVEVRRARPRRRRTWTENSPKTRCWLRCSIRPNVAASQNAVVPPLPSTTSHPSGRANSSREARRAPSRRRRCTGAWRWRRAEPAPAGRGQRLDGLGAHLRRPAAEAPVARAAGRRGSSSGVGGSQVTVPAWHREPHLQPASPTDRRHRRVGHPGRRRQGQGAEGGGRGRHRLRRRRARLPDARRTSSRPRSPPAATRRTTATRPAAGLPELREAIAVKTKRDSRLRLSRPPGAGHQRRQARGATTRSPRCCDPGDEVHLPGAVLDDLPRGDHARRRRAGRDQHRRGQPASGSPSSSSRRPAPPAPRCCCSCRRPTRPARSTRPTRSRPSAGGRVEHGIWVVTDEIYEHLMYGDQRVHVDAGRSSPSWPTPASSLNGVAKTYAMTGWRVGWMIGPEGRHRRRRPTCSRHATSNVANVVAARRAGRGVRRPRRRWPRCARRSSAAVGPCTGCSTTSRASTCLEPQGAFYCFPSLRGRCSAGRSPGAPSTTTLELADVMLDEAKVALVPGEAFGSPGYMRLSFALGDDDLVEGVTSPRRSCFALMARGSSSPRRSPRAAWTTLRAAGHEVDVRLGPDARRSCSRPSRARTRSIIRSATQVTAEVLEAGRRPAGRRAGRHRPRQRRRRRGHAAAGVMVVNAPQSNIVSAAEHTMALAARPGPQRAPGPRRAQGGPVGAVEVGGRRAGRQDARHRRPRPHRQAGRPAGAGLRHAPRRLRPLRQRRRARQMGVELLPLEQVVAEADFLTIHLPRTQGDGRPRRQGAAGPGQAERCASSTWPAAASSTRRRWRGPSARGSIAGAALDVFADEPTTESPLFELDARRGDARTSGRARARRRTRPARPSPRRCSWRWPASSCPSR